MIRQLRNWSKFERHDKDNFILSCESWKQKRIKIPLSETQDVTLIVVKKIGHLEFKSPKAIRLFDV